VDITESHVLAEDRPTERPSNAGPDGEPEHYDAFVSYSHFDREFALTLKSALERGGESVWLDESEIHGGIRWSEELERAIEGSDAFLFLLSPDSAASQECGKELAHAIRLNKRILPVRVRDAADATLPEGLSAYQFIPARLLFDKDYEESLTQLITEIETDRDWVREHTEWAQKAREWEKHDRNPSYLVRGAELEQAEQWRSRSAGKQPGLSELQNEYIDASRQAATRRLRRTRAFVSGALVVAIGLAVFALIQRQQAITQQHNATSGELSAKSVLQLQNDPQLSLLLAGYAANVARTAAALDALRRALPANHLLHTFQTGNDLPIDAAAWSPNGALVMGASEDGYTRVWSAASGRLLHVYKTVAFAGQSAMFVPRGDKLLSGGAGLVQVFDLGGSAPPVRMTGDQLAQFESAQISPDGSVVATASGPGISGTYTLWDARTGRELHTLQTVAADGGSYMGGVIVFNPGGTLVATGSQNGTASIWDVASGRRVRTLNIAEGASNGLQDVFSLAFSPDGTRLAVGAGIPAFSSNTEPEQTQIWSVDSGRLLTSVNGTDPVWSPGSGYIATTSDDGTARVWSASGPPVVAQLKTTYPTTGQAVFAPDVGGQITHVATGSNQGFGAIWNALSGQQLALLAGVPGSVTPAGFSPDGTRVLTYSSDGTLRTWNTGLPTATPVPEPGVVRSSQTILANSESNFLVDPFAPLAAVAMPPPPGSTSGTPGGLEVVDLHSGSILAKLPPVAGQSYATAALDRRGRLLLITRSQSYGHFAALPAQLRAAHGGALIRTLSGPHALATGGILSPDGSLAATIDSSKAITVWNVATGRTLTTFSGHVRHRDSFGVDAVVFKFSPDGSLVLSSDDVGYTYVWQARTGHVLNAIHGLEQPAGMHDGWGGAISPNDQYVVTVSSWDGRAYLYRVGRPRVLLTLEGTAGEYDDAAFAPDSQLFATISSNGGGVSLWDTRDQNPILTMSGSFGDNIAFAPDGVSLITSFNSSPPEQLPCDVCGGFPRLLALAHQRETRGFTPEERALYLGS
jgi:WD40 repeat protein